MKIVTLILLALAACATPRPESVARCECSLRYCETCGMKRPRHFGACPEPRCPECAEREGMRRLSCESKPECRAR